MKKLGPAGRMAQAFIESKLTPLVVAASLLIGLAAILATPKEEEPQIIVPMMDVMVGWPGASAGEVENRLAIPLEKKIWEIPGVEYVYSIASSDRALLIVRFTVGEDLEDSLLKLYNKLYGYRHLLPPGTTEPVVHAKNIDDVPSLALTFTGGTGTAQLRAVALQVEEEIKQLPNVGETNLHGGLSREVRVGLDPARLKAHGLDAWAVFETLRAANVSLPSGEFTEDGRLIAVETGAFLENADDVARLVVSVVDGRPVFLEDVAEVVDGTREPSEYVFYGTGPSYHEENHESKQHILNAPGLMGAVTLSIAKRPGANATELSHSILRKVEGMKGRVIPQDIVVAVTRDYGETAAEKTRELIKHLLLATLSVVILIALALGWREAIVVGVAVPMTLSLTLFIYYVNGYTLNRVTLFALIFSIGILVDDAIVVVENIHRHFTMRKAGESLRDLAVRATDEVGNPTILATFTVIAAILPMAFVSGLMGPYMRPIPVGASVAMIFSLLIAFMISPWLSRRVLARHEGTAPEGGPPETGLTRLYEKIMDPLLHRPKIRNSFLVGIVLLFVGSMAFFAFGWVRVKMLPFDNKSEFQVIIDMPEGTPAETTQRAAREAALAMAGGIEEITDYQIYVGNAAPINFNGLVRHYYLRKEPHLADIQVNLSSKHERSRQSHAIAKSARPLIEPIAERYGASMKVVEIPPGPPVLSTLVAEIYGPNIDRQREIAKDVMALFKTSPGVVDVDWYVEDPQDKVHLRVDHDLAARKGVSSEQIAGILSIALSGGEAGILHQPREKEPVPIRVRLPEADRSSVEALKAVHIRSSQGTLVALDDVIRTERSTVDRTRYRKNLQRVVYVVAEMAGEQESPIYAILDLKEKIAAMTLPEGYAMAQSFNEQPFDTGKYSLKWDGEWQITYETFRDMGMAFGIVLILIFILVVAWFQSFRIPFVIMAPIPLTLVGILPAHYFFGAFFTATSMIGFIAGAGIIVRNSIILVDFIQLKQKEGMPLDQAVIEAGKVRFRPMLLTAAAVVVGSFVILFDPIFQGLAISLMAGEVASTLLSRFAIPVLYFLSERNAKPVLPPKPEEAISQHSQIKEKLS